LALPVHDAEVVLGSGVSLLGGEPIPLDGFGIVLRDAFAFVVHEAEVVLGSGVSLLGGEPIPLDGFGIVLRDAFAFVVPEAKVVLGLGESLLGGEPIPLDDFDMVLRDAFALRRGFKIAIAKELMDWQPKITMLPVQNVRDIDLTPAEYRKLKGELREPVKLLFVLAYHIGWRAGQLIGLKWSQVEFENDLIRRPANQSPTKWVGTAPIYGDLTKALLVARAEHEKHWTHVPWVSHRAGAQVKTYRAEWERARKEIGRPDLHFHDVRHAAVTNMIEAGIDENRVMEIVGHKTQAMLNRYTIKADRHVQEAGRKMEDYFERIRPQDDPKRTVQ
jgi:hypothetical protein